MKIYSYKDAQKIIDRYISKGGEAIQTEEGVLGIGNWICFGGGLKTCIITEVYLNEWSGGQTIRLYNKMPKKYQKKLETV